MRFFSSLAEDTSELLKQPEKFKKHFNAFKQQMGSLKEPIFVSLKEGDDNAFVLENDQFGRKNQIFFNQERVSSLEWKHLRELSSKLKQFLHLPFRVHWGTGSSAEEEKNMESFHSYEEFYDRLMLEAKKGVSIQRYKGLGEMNPDQLWETTLNSKNRRLLRVTLEDSMQADETFSVLMGEMVEPRRQFIYNNALSAGNLDI